MVKTFRLCVDSIDRNNFKALYFLCELGLEEVDVFGHVQSVFSALPNHVGMQNIVSFLKDPNHVGFLFSIAQRTLQKIYQ